MGYPLSFLWEEVQSNKQATKCKLNLICFYTDGNANTDANEATNHKGARVAGQKWKKLLIKHQLKFIEPIDSKGNFELVIFFISLRVQSHTLPH